MQSKPPIVGITMGDAAGIGPEIINKALSLNEIHAICRPIVIGDEAVLSDAQTIARTHLKIQSIHNVYDADFSVSVMNVLDLANVNLSELRFGVPQAMAGKASFDYIKRAVEMALAGDIDAITTAPINKEAMNLAGIRYPGHTEILANLTHSENYAMMFVAGELRVMLVTIHVSLRAAIDLIKTGRVLATIELANESMRRFGSTKPRIVVAGLNPHAGEAGLFGDEDAKEILPAVEAARNMGIDAVGPLPADTVFYRANRKEFDIVVAMYHDQGCIPIKLLGFETGVNITVGLPIIRTSPDHGTAYDRAGRRSGTGNPTSLVEAIKMASRLAAS
jgi:4-hydroxythreonine-4-phosphate dehydrogenase